MRRISQDYSAMQDGRCEICGYRIFRGMYIFKVELKGGRQGVAHSLCEAVAKKTELESNGQTKIRVLPLSNQNLGDYIP